jgi:uncharacterized membrane protein YkgB
MLMSQHHELESVLHQRDFQALDWANRLDTVGRAVLRYGLVALLLLFGAMKFTALEAEGIRPLVEQSPLLAWLYRLLGARMGSSMIGIIELSSALLICTRRWQPKLAAVGSLLAVGTFVVTLSFLFTTPGIMAPENPFGGFIMKDVILLGAALWSSGEALRAAASSQTGILPDNRNVR